MDSSFSLPHDLLDVLKTDNDDDLLEFDVLEDILDFGPSFGDDQELQAIGGVMRPTMVVTSGGPTSTSGNGGSSELTGANEVGSKDDGGNGTSNAGEPKKKRTRNQTQMEMNRVAQRQYRERKKAEQSELQNAVDMLAAQLAAMKAIEVRAADLQARNAALEAQSAAQRETIQVLEQKLGEQSAIIASQAAEASAQAVLLSRAQQMIVDQHARLTMQEEIIGQLKERLKESVDNMWATLQDTDNPQAVCRKMHMAVRDALDGAKDMQGVQETLLLMPEHVVVGICKNILHACQDMWPHIGHRFQAAAESAALKQQHLLMGGTLCNASCAAEVRRLE